MTTLEEKAKGWETIQSGLWLDVEQLAHASQSLENPMARAQALDRLKALVDVMAGIANLLHRMR